MVRRSLVVSTRSQEDRMVSVPTKGSISTGVCSIVHMVRSSVASRGGMRSSISWLTGAALAVSKTLGVEGIILVLVLQLSGLSTEAGHPHDWQVLAIEGREVHVLQRDDQVPGGGTGSGHNSAQCH